MKNNEDGRLEVYENLVAKADSLIEEAEHAMQAKPFIDQPDYVWTNLASHQHKARKIRALARRVLYHGVEPILKRVLCNGSETTRNMLLTALDIEGIRFDLHLTAQTKRNLKNGNEA